LIYYTYKHTYP